MLLLYASDLSHIATPLLSAFESCQRDHWRLPLSVVAGSSVYLASWLTWQMYILDLFVSDVSRLNRNFQLNNLTARNVTEMVQELEKKYEVAMGFVMHVGASPLWHRD
jgi:hypothetical protein